MKMNITAVFEAYLRWPFVRIGYAKIGYLPTNIQDWKLIAGREGGGTVLRAGLMD